MLGIFNWFILGALYTGLFLVVQRVLGHLFADCCLNGFTFIIVPLLPWTCCSSGVCYCPVCSPRVQHRVSTGYQPYAEKQWRLSHRVDDCLKKLRDVSDPTREDLQASAQGKQLMLLSSASPRKSWTGKRQNGEHVNWLKPKLACKVALVPLGVQARTFL